MPFVQARAARPEHPDAPDTADDAASRPLAARRRPPGPGLRGHAARRDARPWRSGSGPADVALVVAAVLTGQLSIGWSNDLVDAAPRPRGRAATDKPLATGEVDERDRAGRLRARGRSPPSPLSLRVRAGRRGWCSWSPSRPAGPTTSGLKSTAWSWAAVRRRVRRAARRSSSLVDDPADAPAVVAGRRRRAARRRCPPRQRAARPRRRRGDRRARAAAPARCPPVARCCRGRRAGRGHSGDRGRCARRLRRRRGVPWSSSAALARGGPGGTRADPVPGRDRDGPGRRRACWWWPR